MSRRIMPYGGECHPGESWVCRGPHCGRVQCHLCDGIPDERFLCWQCVNDRDPGDEAA